jgi:hypothetical protein
MGKAKQQLIKALDSIYYEENDTIQEKVYDKYMYENDEKHLIDTTIILHKRLTEYAENGAWPLCEFLDFTNVENYIKWILNYD